MNPLDAFAAWRDRRTAWWHDDNQFSSRRRMDRAHAPVVALAASALASSRGGAVIDLGCGNGALLSKVARLGYGTVPFGVEHDPARASRARRVLERLGGRAVEGDVFSLPSEVAERRYALVLLSLSRLVDRPAGAPSLLAWVRKHGERLLVFGYGSTLERPGRIPALAASFGLVVGEAHPSGAAALVETA